MIALLIACRIPIIELNLELSTFFEKISEVLYTQEARQILLTVARIDEQLGLAFIVPSED